MKRCYFVEWDDSPGIPAAIIDEAVAPTAAART